MVTILPLRKTMSAGCGTASERAKSTSAPEQLTERSNKVNNLKYTDGISEVTGRMQCYSCDSKFANAGKLPVEDIRKFLESAQMLGPNGSRANTVKMDC
jgi:hypothetical protein